MRGLIDENQTLRNRLREADAENEELERVLAQATLRVEELEAEVDSLREQREEPNV